jgi:ubiquinone/menaquinone biosynthesis C-methylase UbiE
MEVNGPKMSARAGWNIISIAYQGKTRISLEDVHWGPISAGESELKLLGDVRDKKVLEIGCGGGQNAIVLSKWGAKSVGLDISEEQLKYARKLARKEGVKIPFYQGSMEDLSRFRKQSFDIVLSAFGVGYSENLSKTFQEAFRVLRKNGIFVFAETHPMIDRGRIIRRGKRRTWEISNYFDRRKHTWAWRIERKVATFRTRHRTLQDYFDALIRTGFTVERILEPEPYPLEEMTIEERDTTAPYIGDGERSLKNFDIWKKIPFTIIFKARKP